MSNESSKELGESGEKCAAAFLNEKSFDILKRNFRYGRSGEIDIIAKRNNLIVFVEVKNRTSDRFGGALYSISSKKKRNLKLAAKAFLSFHPEYNRPDYTFRFDLISITDNTVEWIEDIVR
ncbi:MAG: YraN family protein [Spirochaetes bacterium RBG_16_49_21]|nr:MAG: YraN family protein [Spirochaetes bacterium RBG_16_49_21]